MNKRRLITGIIYCYTNKINGKKYIGQTTDETDRKRRFNYLNRFYSGTKFHNARQKYGTSDNWIYEVLSRKQYVNEEDASFDLDLLEMYYIGKFNSYNNGYNMNYGGNGNLGLKISNSTKRKISKANRGDKNPNFGKPRTEETKIKISNSLKGHQLNNETKRKISLAQKNRKNEQSYRAVLQIDNETNEIIKEWECIAEVKRILNINCFNISSVCSGKRKSAGGFKWRYKES